MGSETDTVARTTVVEAIQRSVWIGFIIMARDLGVDLASWRGKDALVLKWTGEEAFADISGSYPGSPDLIPQVYT